MNHPQKGNRIILLTAALALAVSSLFVQWGIITIGQADLMEAKAALARQNLQGLDIDKFLEATVIGVNVPVTGLNGYLPLGPMRIPFWLPISAVIAGVFFTITNLGRLTTIPRKLVVALLASGLGAGVWAGYHTISEGLLDTGAFLLIAASVIGLLQQKPMRL